MPYSKDDLEKHLKDEHSISPLSQYLKEIVYGGNDGIVTTFAVVAGFAGANSVSGLQIGYLAVLLFGLANLFADATSMGLGNFLSIRSEQDLFIQEEAKEKREVKLHPKLEKAESVEILIQRGFSRSDAWKLVEIYSTNEDYWVDFMMRYELDIQNPFGQNPVLNAMATFSAFIFFGAIPLFPYMINPGDPNVFRYAIFATAASLSLLGILRWKVTKERLWRSVGEILLVGGLSAAIAYIVGTFFRF